MSWWGKIVGGAFGFILGGPLGAMLGAAVGHNFDRGLQLAERASPFEEIEDNERIQTAFFTAVFSVMGHVSKADGRVSEDEIEMARAVMSQMSLDQTQRRVAMDLFNQGKKEEFDLDAVVAQLKQECGRRRTLLQMFLEILMHAAYADGQLHASEESLLRGIGKTLGFSATHFKQLEALVRAQRFFTDGGVNTKPPADLLAEAYALLGCAAGDSDAEIKRAYRRLMSQHHPDKLIAKGLPEEMVKLATQKTQEIKAAYELVEKQRKR